MARHEHHKSSGSKCSVYLLNSSIGCGQHAINTKNTGGKNDFVLSNNPFSNDTEIVNNSKLFRQKDHSRQYYFFKPVANVAGTSSESTNYMLPSAYAEHSQVTDNETENIYEEVNGLSAFDHRSCHGDSSGSLRVASASFRKTLGEEVMYEVEQVQKHHAQVLQELNLDMENMIMPSTVPSPSALSSTSRTNVDSPSLSSQDGGTYAECCGHHTLPFGQGRHSTLTSSGASAVTPSRVNPSWSSTKHDSLKLHAVTSTPVTRHKWLKNAIKPNNKDAEKEPEYAYSDESIYEEIEQHLCCSNTLRSVGDEQFERPLYKEAEYFSDKTDTEKNTTVSLSSIKHKLRSVRQRMSKGKGKEEKWNLLSKLKESEMSQEKEKHSTNAEFNEPGFPTEIPILRPPCLPPLPKGLPLERVKRRCIISTLIESENSYFMTLKRLLHDYKKPLEESHPPILSKVKINTLFYRLPEIQQCHAMFRIALADCVQQWDSEEKIGDVFVASFSKSMVLDVYSDFINNFSTAMEFAKTEGKRKPAFSEFLKLKQITSPDHLTFFGLMVKPVQRFPQFILLLQDLLRHTPCGHVDRMNLQLALTQLENLTEMLNERKRESEQQHAVRDLLQRMNAKISLKLATECCPVVIREENLALLKLDRDHQIVRKKQRKLILLNNFLICVAVSSAQPGSMSPAMDRYILKWIFPLTDVNVQEELSPVLGQMLLGSAWGKIDQKRSEFKENDVHVLSQEIANLMHDFEAISRIAALITTLKQSYQGLTLELVQHHLQTIVQLVQAKDQEMQVIDNCCLQLLLPIRSKQSKDLVIFQTSSIKSMNEWLTDIRLSKLAMDSRNSPSWHVSEPECIPTIKMPLFAQSLALMKANFATEVKATCHYTHFPKQANGKVYKFLWVCSSDGVNSHISVLHLLPGCIKNIVSFDMAEVRISTMEAVPGLSATSCENGFDGWTVWMGTDSRKIIMFSATDPEHHRNLGSVSTLAPVLQLRYYKYRMFSALANGMVVMYPCNADGKWQIKNGHSITLGSDPVTSLLTHDGKVYCSCGRKLYIIDGTTGEIKKSFPVHNEQPGNVYLLAQSGIGLWINLRNTGTICLYHMENFQHLQDFNITANINRMLAQKNQAPSPRCIFVTSLMACRGLLWVGTNVGIVLTIPLPRLEGIPIVSGHAATSFHALNGPVTVLSNLNTWNYSTEAIPAQNSATFADPLNEEKTKETLDSAKKRNTLPHSGCHNENSYQMANGTVASSREASSSQEKCDVYGLYGDLLNAKTFTESQDNIYEPLQNDPSFPLDATLPREVQSQIKTRRPNSLDLSNVSLHIKADLSSSSEDSSSTKSFFSIPEMTPPPQLNTNGVDVPASSSKSDVAKTVTVIMGGRGYHNIHKQMDTMQRDTSNNNANIVFWETRV